MAEFCAAGFEEGVDGGDVGGEKSMGVAVGVVEGGGGGGEGVGADVGCQDGGGMAGECVDGAEDILDCDWSGGRR